MEFVYEVKDKQNLLKILEQNPYEPNSFSRIGYQIKENWEETQNILLKLNITNKSIDLNSFYTNNFFYLLIITI